MEEWFVKIVPSMHRNAQSRVRVYGTSSDDFPVKVGSDQASMLSPLLFTIVIEAL